MTTQPHPVFSGISLGTVKANAYTVTILKGDGRRYGLYCGGNTAEVAVWDRLNQNVTYRFTSVSQGSTLGYARPGEVAALIARVAQAF